MLLFAVTAAADNPKSALKLDPATDDSVAAALKDIKMAIQSTRMIQQQQQTASSGMGTREEFNANNVTSCAESGNFFSRLFI